KKFDEVLQSGNMVTASDTGSVCSTESYDSGESASSTSGLMPPPMTSNNNNSRAVKNRSSSVTVKDGKFSSFYAPPTGGVDEETFIRDFTSNLPTIRLYGARDVDDQMNRIQSVISDEKKDWEERSKYLKTLRAVALAGGTDYDTFYEHLRVMEPSLNFNAKDLRSQVVRETCVTVGCLSSILKNQFEHTACVLMPTLFNLIKNSAKVMSTSGVLTILTILKHTHGPRLIPMITINCTSKTTALRRKCFIFLDIILQQWASNLLDRHLAILKESVHKGINDADSETREEARKAWWALQSTFPNEAEQVFSNLNPSQQKLIKGHLATSVSSVDSQPKFDTRFVCNYLKLQKTLGHQCHPLGLDHDAVAGLRASGTPNGRFIRSRSDIDPASAKRSKIKAMSSGYDRFYSLSPLQPPGQCRQIDRVRSRGALSPGAQQPHRTFGMRGTTTPGRTSQSHASRDHSPNGRSASHGDYDSLFGDGYGRTRTPPSSPTPTRKSRIPISSRTNSRAGSRVGLDYLSQSFPSRIPRSEPVSRHRSSVTSSQVSSRDSSPGSPTVPCRRKADSYGLSDNDDDFSDTSSVCSDRSSSYTRNGLKRHTAHSEDIVEILQLCQSGVWTERKEGLFSLHTLINKHKEFNRLQIKKILETFNRMFADPHGKTIYISLLGSTVTVVSTSSYTPQVFSMFLEILPDFIQGYKDLVHDWLYFLLTQLLKKMGTDLLGSVQNKVLKALQVTRESFPASMQFNILSRYIVDQTQKPSLKVKVALLHHMLDLTGVMKAQDISNTSDNRLAISRIITWTTEPKSQDVRKIAEALVISIFELNASVFTMMIQCLPKTFQDGAMKVLRGYMKTNGETNVRHVVGRVALSPSRNVVSPRGSLTHSTIPPNHNKQPRRGSVNVDTENMNQDEITENFRDITASIQKLRMDSSADISDAISNKSPGIGASPLFNRPGYPPPLQQLQNSPKVSAKRANQQNCTNLFHPLPPGRQSKYNPNTYSEQLSPFHKGDLKDAIFDDDDSFNEELPLEMTDNVSDVAHLLTQSTDKRHALDELSRTLRASDAVVGLAASQQQIQWDVNFNVVLSGVLEILRTGDVSLMVAALRVLREMLRHLAHRFKNFTEITIIHIIESHRDGTNEMLRAAEEASNALCCAVPPILCVKVLSPLTKSSSVESTQACLKMLTNAINRCSREELDTTTISALVPGLLQCYDNTESGVRKAAVFCLVALHRVIGDAELCQHLRSLSAGKMKLLQLYIKRSQT
uniref:TOG domain-containing protein n=1 Tax=Ciona savignyi TaxID=51511 RepID=H2Z9Q0_CIOSA